MNRWGAHPLRAVALLFLLVGGCGAFDPGASIAEDIRRMRHPAIERIEYRGEDDSGPFMDVILVEGATREQAIQLACEVIGPAIERGKAPPEFGFEVMDPDGNTLASDVHLVTCT